MTPNQNEGLDKHHLNCKICGKFMVFKGKSGPADCEYDSYQCECGVAAYVTEIDGDREVMWSD